MMNSTGTDVEQRCKSGDLWALGPHRLICADSTQAATIQRLLGDAQPHMVFADPPYGINVAKSGKLGKGTGYRPVIGDESNETALAAYRLCADFKDAVHIWWGANYYANGLPNSRCWIVWNKENGTTSFADGELAWTNIKTSLRIFRHKWNGAVRASERGQRRFHPNQKPVMLAVWFYQKYGAPNDIIFDPFIGSGITILAAETIADNRIVYGCEIDPLYCDVTIARYEAFSGDIAHLLERRDPS